MSTNLAGKTVLLNDTAQDIVQGAVIPGAKYRVENLWTEVYGKSWTISDGNPAAINYAIRVARTSIPNDDNVYYGKIDGLGYLVHESEIGAVVS